MRIAVVGGTKFIGAAAVRRALARGHDVTVLHRGVHPNPSDDANDVLVDRGDPAALRTALHDARPDVVVDTRAMTRADADTITAAAKGLDATLVVLSSQDVYAQFGRLLDHPGPEPEVVITEDSPLGVPYPYRGVAEHTGGDDYDKKLVEARLREAVAAGTLPGATVLRLPPTYGLGDPARRFGGFVDALDAGDHELPCTERASWRWTHGHVDDVAVAIALAVEARAPGFELFNVGEPDTPTMREWVERIAAELAVPLSWRETTDELADPLRHLGAMANDVVVDSNRIRNRLGYAEITTLEQRVRDVIASARASRA